VELYERALIGASSDVGGENPPENTTAQLNDAFRTTMSGGRVMMTAGVDALPSDVKAMVTKRTTDSRDGHPRYPASTVV
jgi:hypothetical protein